MKYKKKCFDVIVLGSGLSSLSFIDIFLKKKKEINIISPTTSSINNININQHIYKFLPPQMLGKDNKVRNFYYQNKIKVNKNCKVFGTLEFGGLSNYWALQIDRNIESDIKHLTEKTRKQIMHSFKEFFLNENTTHSILNNLSIKQKNFDFPKGEKKILIEYPILGYLKKRVKNFNLDSINENKDKLIPTSFFHKFMSKKKIIFHDYCVNKIMKEKNKILLICTNNKDKKEKIFLTKKLVIGCGTIVTTKLLMDFLKIKNEVKIKHHPRLFSLYFSKKKWENKMNFQPSVMHLKDSKKPDLFTTDFRPGNEVIISSIIKLNKILLPFRYLLNYFRQYMIFSNTFLNSKFSNLYMKIKDNSWVEIYSKNKKLNKIFKSTSNVAYKFLLKQNKIFSFRLNHFPGFGVDFHYFGTIPINGKKKLSVNENCQLKNNKNIYVIDGSVFDFKKNKYPLGLTMANARRVAKNFKI